MTSDLDKHIKAGRIAAEAREYGKSLIKPGTLLVEVVEKIEEKIRKLGAEPGFPAQISLNEIAAHYCPPADDKTEFSDQVVCLDVGVSVDGFIGDTAVSIDLSGEHADLIKASREALNNAIKILRPGLKIREIGRVIEQTITDHGFKPVRNLSGHGLGQYQIHTHPSIPNYDNGDETELQDGQAIAIEPFATNGIGMIEEKGVPTVFQLTSKRPTRSLITRNVLKEIEKYKGNPFTNRWLIQKFGLKANFAMKELRNLGCLTEHPPLVERSKGLVSQFEHSFIIKDKPIILTQL